MKGELTRLVIGTIKVKCPLYQCKDKFRVRYNLFTHIREEHSRMELEKYLIKKSIKLKG